jgi:hypothetical protein
MPIERYDGRVVLRFGDGDIVIAPASDTPDGDEIHVAFGMIDGGKKYPIDIVIPEIRGKQMDEWAIKMFFPKVESLDSVIHVLQDFRKMQFGEQVKT